MLTRNRILRTLPAIEWNKLSPHLVPAHFVPGQMIYEHHQTIDDVFFIESGVVSQLTETEGMEARQIGYEGLIGGVALFDKGYAVLRTVARTEVRAQKIAAATARNLFEQCPAFHTIGQQYLHVVLATAAQMAACNLQHSTHERLARWLLMFHDRLRDDTLPVTHEIIAAMLGVWRPAVSQALHHMQEQGLVHQARGRLTILDVAQLEAQACRCYEFIRSLYAITA